jgi:phosphatidylglycerophosphatase A
MANDSDESAPVDSGSTDIDEIVGRGPAGAFAIAGIATAIVVALYFAFYFFIYLPRGAVQ